MAVLDAAVLPLQKALDRDAAGLCGSFTPEVAASLVVGSEQSCVQAVTAVMASAAASDPPPAQTPQVGVASRPQISVRGSTAVAVFTASYESSAGVTILVPLRLGLERVEGKWLVASPAVLVVRAGCRPGLPKPCPAGAQHLALIFVGIGQRTLLRLPVPAAVRRAGRGAVGQFRAGEYYVASSGCLACHRIDDEGNRGPGPGLTHVAARLGSREIRHALLDPTAPMPSFNRMPPHKLRDVIAFLAALK